MIIKGNRRGGAKKLAAHLLRRDTNEEVIIREIAGYPTRQFNDQDLQAVLRHMAVQGQAKGKLRTLYHSILAPQQGEKLNAKQLKHAVDTLAKNLGMEGHNRTIVEHQKDGRQHFHVVFNILHPTTGKQARLQWTKKVEWNTSRQLEQELGLKAPVPKGKAKKRWEHERGKRSGLDALQVRKEVTAIFRTSKTGKEFVNNLAAAGYVLTIGRNNSYVLVDKAGDIHGLMRRIEGAKLKDLRQRFPDLKHIALPSIESILKERRPQRAIHHTKNGRHSSKHGHRSGHGQKHQHHAGHRHGKAKHHRNYSARYYRSGITGLFTQTIVAIFSHPNKAEYLAKIYQNKPLWIRRQRNKADFVKNGIGLTSKTRRKHLKRGALDFGQNPLPSSKQTEVHPHRAIEKISPSVKENGSQKQPIGNFGKDRTTTNTKSVMGNKPSAPSIRKSYELATMHSAQWMGLTARYAAKRAAAAQEPDEAKREMMFLAIEQEEEAERASLAARQQLETDSEMAAQIQEAVRQEASPRSIPPKPH